MIQPRSGAAAGNGKVHAWILDHPFGVVAPDHARANPEHSGIEADVVLQVVNSYVDVEALHLDLLCRLGTGLQAAATGMHWATFPWQQFSVRKLNRSLMATKSAE